ncbi:putative trans-sialidase [Phaeomoniella chlamydospora]|uniref:Putative trans-sialidase n=1 Tax=Phaeomoniella chlamydospora TaxID=158046 RepID=A0A0G2GN22_PHACM|nr:putative trans-sialidase [Phaeomoniella chlamydospora]
MYNVGFKGGGPGVMMLMAAVGVGFWALGKTQGEANAPGHGTAPPPDPGASGPGFGPGGPASGAGPAPTGGAGTAPPPRPGPAPNASASAGAAGAQPNAGSTPKSSWQRPNTSTNTGASPKPAATGSARSNWEKAREETKKKQEEMRKAEELKKRREEMEKRRQEQREKDAKEREERERKEKEEAAKKEIPKREPPKEVPRSFPKKPPHPTARTEAEDDAYSFRPYDRPKRPYKANSSASMYSESSYAASQTTARTTPPPSHRGPYTTNDPDKIIIKAVYSFNNAFMQRPIAQLIAAEGNVTDGLILRITTEGLFIDDDVRGVPQREWDVKAWTLKLAESAEMKGMHVLRASIRDQEGKKYVFVIDQSEGWKVAIGLQRLRRGSQVRALGVAGLPMNEAKMYLDVLGWL